MGSTGGKRLAVKESRAIAGKGPSPRLVRVETPNAEEMYGPIIEAMNEGLLAMDPKGCILFCNERFCQMVKRPGEDILGQSLTTFAAPPEAEAILALLTDAKAGPVRRRLALKVSDGAPLFVQLSASLLNVIKPPAICMVVSDVTGFPASDAPPQVLRQPQDAPRATRDRLATDLTRETADRIEQMQAIEDLKTRTEQLDATNKELESFSYSVSHDLRAPLRAIEGFSRMILKKYAATFNDDIISKFNVIRDNTRMMGQLIEDLLAFSRLGKAPLSMARIDPEELISEAWKELKTRNPERRLTLAMSNLPACMGDRDLLKQVFANLLVNAVKFTKPRKMALIEVGGEVKGNDCLYFIKDNGIGFDMTYHDKMFGVFQRLHSPDEFEGTGVGLAIVQRIIHRHGGKIWAEGKMDGGATFYLTLPMATAASPGE